MFPSDSIAVVGPGRLGRAISTALRDAGLAVEGPLGRGEPPTAPVVLLCVPDAAIAGVAAAMPGAALVGHCSGATTLGACDFSLHPLMTVPESGASFAGVPAAVAGHPVASELAERLGMRPFFVADEDRAAYHAAASVASNFLVTLEASAERLAAGAGLEPGEARALLAPLVLQTARNWAELGPERALTGPVARGDEVTVAAQRAAVQEAAPELVALFDELVERTRELAGRGVSA
jgi:predicted short-subunit dehydrogenase-like oxidoreductase (DUF2520 family)